MLQSVYFAKILLDIMAKEGTSKQVAVSLLTFLGRTYCAPRNMVKHQAANLTQDLLNCQNPCYVAFMKKRIEKPRKQVK